jgi:hypothetical protein
MLTTATLGMAIYGGYSIVWGLIDLFFRSRVGFWADLALIAFGVILIVAAAFVRVLIPGGLALAIGALLGLQALSIHTDVHVAGRVVLVLQAVRGGFAVLMVGLALEGGRRAAAGPRAPN